MKMFFSVLCAILVAAVIFYFIKDMHDTDVAVANVNKAVQHSDNYLAALRSLETPTPIPPEPGIEMNVTKAIRIKTPDGEVIIPKGARVRVLREKSEPGMTVINYQGYTTQVPSDAVSVFSNQDTTPAAAVP